MANINPLSQKYFESYAQELKSKFQRVRELTSHPNASGDYHEELLRNVLRNFLTDRFSVKTGFIYKDAEHVSKQIDIMVIDETAPAAYLFKDGQFAVVTPEAVVATIEVKTHMGERQFTESIDNVRSIKELFEYPNSVTSLVFGYKGTSANDATLHKWFLNRDKLDEKTSADGFLFFGASRLLLRWDDHFKNGKKYRKLFIEGAGATGSLGWQLSVVVAAVISSCESRHNHQGPIIALGRESVGNRLMQAEGGCVSDDYFEFGIGHVSN